MTDWTTIASLATAGGTLVLALATFASVRSANRSARLAEYSMQIGIRPLLMPSRLEDAAQKIMWGDEEGAQRAITAFLLAPGKERWLCSAVRHRNLDRPDPR